MKKDAMKKGVKEQEPAEPAVTEKKPEEAQSPEENARYAGIRRRAEAEAQKRLDEIIRQKYQGLTNPETGAAVETEEDARAYEEAVQRQRLAAAETPGPEEVRLAGELQALSAMRDEAAREQFVRRQLEELEEAFPGCGVTAEEMPEELGRRWAATGSLLDAYRLVHFEELQEACAAAARQQLLNHLRATRQLSLEQAAGHGSEVSESDLRSLRRMLPGRNERELREMLLKVK